MLEKLLNKFGYVKKASKWERLLAIEPPYIDDRDFHISCLRIVNEVGFEKGIDWLIKEALKKITEDEEMMDKDMFRLLMAGILATDNVKKQFRAWGDSVKDEDEETFDEYSII